jgi:hypothetical protein
MQMKNRRSNSKIKAFSFNQTLFSTEGFVLRSRLLFTY